MKRGERIRKRREELGISQAELGRLVGRTRSLISNIEKTDKVNDLTYFDIISILGLTPETEDEHFLVKRFDKVREAQTPYLKEKTEVERDVMKREIAHLQEIIELQRSVIEMLKGKKG
jgi:transcriptional regulator with XRE-family HTH domain